MQLVAKNFGQVVIASVDHIFAPVQELRAEGEVEQTNTGSPLRRHDYSDDAAPHEYPRGTCGWAQCI
jgi:hypothetical protein